MAPPAQRADSPPALRLRPPPRAPTQARHGGLIFLTMVFSAVLLSSVNFTSCWSYLDGSLGMAPVQARR